MAVPGADRRKSTDGTQTGGSDPKVFDRLKSNGVPPAAGSDAPIGATGVGTFGENPSANNTGKHGVQVLDGIAETDDSAIFGPPAIEVTTKTAVAAKLSGPIASIEERRFGEPLRRKRHLSALFGIRSERRRRRRSRRQTRSDGTKSAGVPRETVITK